MRNEDVGGADKGVGEAEFEVGDDGEPEDEADADADEAGEDPGLVKKCG